MKKDRTVEFDVLYGLIMKGALSNVAAELEYVERGDERLTLLAYLIDTACEQGEHDLVKKIFRDFDTDGLSRELIRKVHALAETCEVADDFQESLPTIVGHPPL